MNCPKCDNLSKKDGKDRKGDQRFKCTECGKRFTLAKEKLLGSMILNESKALLCLNLLVEGNSVRSTERISGVHRDTILSLLKTVGEKCLWIQENLVLDVKVKFVQADGLWSYFAMKDKAKNAKQIESDKIGSVYTFTAIDSETKLMVAWHLGKRSEQDTLIFCEKIYKAIEGGTRQFPMSTDGFKGYDHSVNEALGTKAHHGQIIRLYGTPNPNEVRHSPAECVGCKMRTVFGNPIKDKISTLHVERQILTMRMSMRRFTRLTNDFSKKWDNLNYMLAIYFAYYNFCRVHKTLRGTPAMEAGLAKSNWTLKDLLQVTTGK